MIVERDGVQLPLHPSNEPPTRHGAFWIRVSNIESLYQEFWRPMWLFRLRSGRSAGASKNFTAVIPFETSLFSPRVSMKGSAEQAS
jgi:hypothetical protein